MATVITGGKTYAAAASTRRESKSVECQTSLTWGFQNVHLGRLSLTCVLLADPYRYRPALRLPPGCRGRYRPTPGCEAAKCSSETDTGSADPPKTASRGSANPHKMASKGSAAPSKRAPKGSAGPLKPQPRKMIHHLRGDHLLR